MQSKKVYTIIVTYNGMQWIEKCLAGLQQSSFPCRVILIDNGSTDQTVSFVKLHYPQVAVFETGKNLGFGQANNIGMAMAIENKADYVFLLNQDAWVESDTIANLLAVHDGNRHFGILSPMHLNGAGNNFDPWFLDYLLASDVKADMYSLFSQGQFPSQVINTRFVNAAAWLISIECLEKTGGFDPIFFHYGEDDNYAHRVLYKGFKIGIVPDARIYHDKTYPLKTGKDIKQVFKHDWIIFLHQACDIRRRGYKRFMLKRFCRYAMLSCGSMIFADKDAFYYNFCMVKKIPFSLLRIHNSRQVNQTKTYPHLEVGTNVNMLYPAFA